MPKLTTPGQLAEAQRLSWPVQIIGPDDETLALGYIMSFTTETVTILEFSVGVVHFLLENVKVWALDRPAN